MTRPAAYLRKSKDAATKADHLALLTRSVAAFGLADPVVYDDWARSGDIRKLSKRTGWRELCAAIERGEHTTVFMNSLDRGGRSVEEWARFMRVARDHGVRVIADGVDWASPEKKLEFHLRAVFAEEELDRARARAASTVGFRRARGDVVVGGHHAPYGAEWVRAGDAGIAGDPRRVVEVPNEREPLQPLLDAVTETRGNVLAACRLLNERRVPTRTGAPWDPRVLTRALDRQGALRARRGASVGGRRRGASDAPLSRLVVCHCGATMTPERDPRNGRWLGLVCTAGRKLGKDNHGRYLARAHYVMEFLRDRLNVSTIRIVKSSTVDVPAARADLDDRRQRLTAALADGMNTTEYRRRMDILKREVAALADAEDVESDWVGTSPREPLVDWGASDTDVGERLRRLVTAVHLDETMLPVTVEWRVPWLARSRRTL
jgi:DNA invertase Pin-like site-specific DNA recombinase